MAAPPAPALPASAQATAIQVNCDPTTCLRNGTSQKRRTPDLPRRIVTIRGFTRAAAMELTMLYLVRSTDASAYRRTHRDGRLASAQKRRIARPPASYRTALRPVYAPRRVLYRRPSVKVFSLPF